MSMSDERPSQQERISMRHFSGFPAGKQATVALPEQVFTELIPHIDDLAELQVTLIALWRLAQMRSDSAPWITETELCAEPAMRAAFGEAVETEVGCALARAVARGTLLLGEWERADGTRERRYFANSPRGRAAVEAMAQGRPPMRAERVSHPNIFTLYEQNIGPLSALLSEELMEAEKKYPAAWIEEAFREAISRNKRNWKYIHAILERWWTEGKDEEDRRNRERDRRRYIEGKYRDIIQH